MSLTASLWNVVHRVKATVWRPQLLPYPALWVFTRVMFVPTIIYNLVYYALMRGKRQWWNRITEDMVLGAMPWWFQFDELVKSENIGGLVNLIQEFGGHLTQMGEIEKRGLRELYIPTPDYIQPELKDIEKAMAFIDSVRQQGRCVYVHCKSGKGRAPTIVICYLMKSKNMTPREAQDYVVARRPHISKDLYLREGVIAYHRKLLAQRGNAPASSGSSKASSKPE